MEELVDVGNTDVSGKLVYKTEGRTKYVAVLEGIPEGYEVKDCYEITQVDTVIKLGTVLVKSEDLSKEKFVLGSIMKDFSVSDPEGKTYTLSELLEKKDAVVLNFWYLTCIPCKEEFPLLQEAYEKYKDKIEVLAMNPVNSEDEEIAEYAAGLGLTFPVVHCEEGFATAFGVTSYPTTVVIDKYGMVSFIKDGKVDKKEFFESVFAYYQNENYVQRMVNDISEIAAGYTVDESESTENGTENGTQEPDDGKMDYKITVKDSEGKAVSSVGLKVGESYGSTDASGVLSIRLEPGTYEVTVAVPEGYEQVTEKYQLTETENQLDITIKASKKDESTTGGSGGTSGGNSAGGGSSAGQTGGDKPAVPVAKKTQQIWEIPRYEVFEGSTSVPIEKLPGDSYCYVVFNPKRSGTFKVEVSDNGTKLSEHSASILSPITENLSGNVLTLNIKDSYLSPDTKYVFGLTGANDCVLTITRTGDAVLDESDYPYTTYSGTHKPSKFTYKGSGNRTYFDVSAASGLKISDIVLGSDGFYHHKSAGGPVIYLDFDNKKLSLYEMVIGRDNMGGTGFRAYIYDSNGNFQKKEDYAACLTSYINCRDGKTNLYPLTEDLRYIMEVGGRANGWYDGASKEMIFGSTVVKPETAWLFLCCYDE